MPEHSATRSMSLVAGWWSPVATEPPTISPSTHGSCRKRSAKRSTSGRPVIRTLCPAQLPCWACQSTCPCAGSISIGTMAKQIGQTSPGDPLPGPYQSRKSWELAKG